MKGQISDGQPIVDAIAQYGQDLHFRERPSPKWGIPVRIGTSMSKAMGFDGPANPGFSQFTRIVRALVPQYIDVRRVYSEQDPEQIEIFVKKVAERVPWITRYEDCWPIEGYAKRWLEGARWRNKHLKGLARLGQQGTVEEATTGYEPKASYSSPRKQSGDHYISLEVLHSDPSDRSGTPANAPSTPARSEPIPSSASASAIHEIDAPAGGPAAFEPREQFIRGFLRGIQPGMEDLTQNFMSAGVVNKMCLVSLAGMPNWEKDKLLRDDMSLTPFQVRAVRVGLAGLQA